MTPPLFTFLDYVLIAASILACIYWVRLGKRTK